MKSQTRMVVMAAGLAVVSAIVYVLTLPSAPAPAPRVELRTPRPIAATGTRTMPVGPQLVVQRYAEPVMPQDSPPAPEQPSEPCDRELTVKVIDENDSPVAGLSAAIQWSRPNELDSNPYGRTAFCTGEDGASRVGVPDGAGKGRFFVQGKAWRQADYTWFRTSGTTEVVLRVYSTRSLRLNIRYADGRAYGGKVMYAGCGAIECVATEGIAVVPDMPVRDGMISVFSQRPGYEPLHRDIKAEQIAAGGEMTLTIEQSSRPLGLLRVKVRKAPDDKEPIAELACQLWSVSRARTASTRDFRFVSESDTRDFANLAPGDYVIRACSGGYVALKEVSIVAGEVTNVELDWEPAASVRAEVVVAGGTPLAGAVVRRVQSSFPTFPALHKPGTQAVADSDGLACLTGLPVGPCELVVEAPGYEPAHVRAELARAGELNLGRVTLEKAVASVVVELRNYDPGTAYTVQLGYGNGTAVGGMAKLGRDGRAVFEDVPAREYTLLVSAESAAPQFGPGARMYTNVLRKDFTLRKSDPSQRVLALDLAESKSGS